MIKVICACVYTEQSGGMFLDVELYSVHSPTYLGLTEVTGALVTWIMLTDLKTAFVPNRKFISNKDPTSFLNKLP